MHRPSVMNEVYRVWGGLKSVLSNIGLRNEVYRVWEAGLKSVVSNIGLGNEVYRVWEAGLKSVLSNIGLGIKAKKCLYEGVIVPTALYGAEAW